MDAVELFEGYATYASTEEVAAADTSEAPAITSTVTSSQGCAITISAIFGC